MLAAGATLAAGWAGAIFAVPFLIGLASGGQGIYAKLGADWLRVLKTAPGWAYWLSRGVVPALCYWAAFAYQLGSQHSLSAALICGLGSEAVLRSQFFIGSKTIDGKTQDIRKGVFDLVEWYQNLLLRSASDSLAEDRQKFINGLLGATTDFPALCAKAKVNAASFQVSGEEIRAIIDAKLAAFQKEPAAQNGAATADLHRAYACELGYALLQAVNSKSLKTLLGQ